MKISRREFTQTGPGAGALIAVGGSPRAEGRFLLKYAPSHATVTAAIPGMTKPRHVEDILMAATGRMSNAAERRRRETFFDAL